MPEAILKTLSEHELLEHCAMPAPCSSTALSTASAAPAEGEGYTSQRATTLL